MNLTSQGKNLTFVHFNILTVYLTNVKLTASREERKERCLALHPWKNGKRPDALRQHNASTWPYMNPSEEELT
jgi:hypothetical protein